MIPLIPISMLFHCSASAMHPLRSNTNDLHHIHMHPPTTSSFRSLPSFINQLNDTTVGNDICGLLYKWVNYARGWRPRWFILHDAVLSYYNADVVHSASKLTGFRRSSTSPHRKPLGQVHLMVCSVREHKSNEKRFCVYTGMKKRLHLRAETKEDRAMWVEAMLAVKDVFPRTSNSIAESKSESESMMISTHRLRQRLLEEGVGEATIQESENIMRSEISHVLSHNHFNLNLIDTVESQRQQYSKDEEDSFISMLEKDSEGSASDSTHENYRDAFFDTCDILSTCSGRSNGSQQYQRSCIDSECEESSTNGEYEGKSFNGSNYPHVRRRKKLPDPVEKEKGVSLWSIIKDNIGKDLTNICLPVYFNEPISSLQKCFEDLEYSYLLDQAYACGKMGNGLMRMLHVAAFAVSGYACTDQRSCKPFNPLLGETYEADYPDKGIRFISEKVSHHPMIVACHCEGKGWKFWGDSNLKSKFWGRSIHIDPVGVLTLEFDDGEVFRWSKVTTAIYNLILGKIYCDHYGTMRIEGNREYSCKIKFKEQSIIDKNPHQVHGVVEDQKGKVVASLCGKWDESLHYTIVENSGKGKGSNVSSKARQLWKRSEPSDYPTRYNLTQFAITLNEITPKLREKLPPTDSRLRPDQRCLENGDYEKANAEKLHLEQRQRQARKIQEKGWKPRWFAMDKDSHTYCYVGGYWEAREKGNWESCSDIFGQLPTDTDTDFDPTN